MMSVFRFKTDGLSAGPAACLAGFTLVEILVSAGLLAIALVAIVSIIRKAWDIEMDNLHRRQARTIVVNRLESQKYDYTGYTDLATSCSGGCPAINDSTVTIDPRSSNPLTGTLKTKLTMDNTQLFGTTPSVPRVIVRISVTWDEPGYMDSVWIEKWLSPAL